MKGLGLAVFFLFILSASAGAYVLPEYSISDSDASILSNEALTRYISQVTQLADPAIVARLKEHEKNPKIRLTLKQRGLAAAYKKTAIAVGFWNYVVELKASLMTLQEEKTPEISAEADLIARDVIARLYELSQKWHIGNSALFNNLLINTGIRKKGFCYHYVEELKNALSKRELTYFDLHWGTAWEGDFRENNSLVITARGKPFETGVAIDAWRTAGRPFWTAVKGDRFPWIENFN